MHTTRGDLPERRQTERVPLGHGLQGAVSGAAGAASTTHRWKMRRSGNTPNFHCVPDWCDVRVPSRTIISPPVCRNDSKMVKEMKGLENFITDIRESALSGVRLFRKAHQFNFQHRQVDRR